MLFNKIIVPVDGSKHSIKAAEYARGIARTQGSKIVLLHCYGHIPMLVGGHAREELVKELEQEALQVFEPYRKLFAENGLELEEVVAEGNPADVICAAVSSTGADLVVIGSRGLTDLEGFFLGSVSHTVVNRACSPVLVVR